MKKSAVFVLVIMFAACLFHFYYAEDHCPVHCPSRGGRLGHVHPHHAGASQCLCIWSTLMSPDTDDVVAFAMFVSFLPRPAGGPLLAMMAPEITPPPRSVPA